MREHRAILNAAVWQGKDSHQVVSINAVTWEARPLLSEGDASIRERGRVGKALSKTENSCWGPHV